MRITAVAVIALALAARVAVPAPGLETAGLLALANSLSALMLAAATVLLAAALGQVVFKALGPPGASGLERAVMALALGLGLLASGLTLLGLAGWLRPPAIAGLLLASAWIAGPGLLAILKHPPALMRRAVSHWRRASGIERAAALLLAAIALTSLFLALSPPWDYDGLMYHLVGPQHFLAAGRILPHPDNWYVNGAFAGEMLFTIGLAFGDDVFPKLLHWSSGLLLCAATYAAARRWVGPSAGWLSVVVLLGAPALPIWAAFAHIDLAWGTFEFLALSSALIGWQARSSRWLLLSGIFAGLGAGSKYLGLIGIGLLALLVAASAFSKGRTAVLRALLSFAVPAVLLAAPWYLKNLLWFGNPVYPLYFSAPGWSESRQALYQAYLGSFGVGRGLVDTLLLPVHLYTRHSAFGAVTNQNDIPALVFPLVLLYPLARRNRAVSAALALSFARFLLWAAGSQQIRFLLPVYPVLAVACAAVIDGVGARVRPGSAWKAFLPLLAVGMTVITLFYQARFLQEINPLPAAVGMERREEFLARTVHDFRGVRATLETDPEAHILLLGNGRGYYCLPRCTPDPDHFRWSAEIMALSSSADLTRWFEQHGVSHVLLSWMDLDFLLQHDPSGIVGMALARLRAHQESGCLHLVYDEPSAAVMRVECGE